MTRRNEIDQLIAASKTGVITAEEVVDAARNSKKFPELHKYLWEPSEAELAHEARLGRAHKLLISIRVVTEDATTTRMLVHTNGTRGYQAVETVIATPSLASIKLKQLVADIGRARERLATFRSILPPETAEELDALLDRAQKVAEPAPAREAAA